jgi:hypothetical protein
VSAKPKVDKPLSQAQFVTIIVVLALSGVLALVTLGGVAGPHGKCPSPTQVSRPGASVCWAAYRNGISTGVVAQPASSPAAK